MSKKIFLREPENIREEKRKRHSWRRYGVTKVTSKGDKRHVAVIDMRQDTRRRNKKPDAYIFFKKRKKREERES